MAYHVSGDLKRNAVLITDLIITVVVFSSCGSGSSVGIATDHGLDGPGSNPVGDEIFCPYRPALGPTLPPVR